VRRWLIETIKGGKVTAVAAASKKTKKTVVLATAKVTIPRREDQDGQDHPQPDRQAPAEHPPHAQDQAGHRAVRPHRDARDSHLQSRQETAPPSLTSANMSRSATT
jgi:hypothetical protein